MNSGERVRPGNEVAEALDKVVMQTHLRDGDLVAVSAGITYL